MTIDINSAVAYNRTRTYTRDQWCAICAHLERCNAHDVPWLTVGTKLHDNAEVARAVANYQKDSGLTVDGKLGPQTERHMVKHGLVLPVANDAAWLEKDRWATGGNMLSLTDAAAIGGYDAARAVHGATMDANAWPRLSVAQQREWIALYWGDDKPRANWCGAFVASALEAGGVQVPPNTRRGAKRLTRWVAEHGQWIFSAQHIQRLGGLLVEDASMLRPGDVLCWNRGTLAALRDGEMSWHGHVAFLRAVMPDGGIDILEGNVRDPETGKRGQLVHRFLGPDEWPHRRKDGLRGLFGVVRP